MALRRTKKYVDEIHETAIYDWLQAESLYQRPSLAYHVHKIFAGVFDTYETRYMAWQTPLTVLKA